MGLVDVKRKQVQNAIERVDQKRCPGDLLVGQVMTGDPSCISADTTVFELIMLFHTKQFRHLLVTDADGRLIGIVSDRDVIRCLGPGNAPDRTALSETSAGDIMSTDLLTVGPDTDLERAVILIVEHGISCLPVIVGDELVGILTNTDLHVVLQILLQSLPQASSEELAISGVSNPQS